MFPKEIQKKGILSKILEKGIEVLLKKECKKISKVKINIIASSIQIIKGIIKKINIKAEEINYKDLFFDEVELEANEVKVIFKINKKNLDFRNNFIIKFKLSLSEKSLKKILLSKTWNWIGAMISKEILNQNKIEDIKIKDGKILFKILKNDKLITQEENFNIKSDNGQLYIENKAYKKYMNIPIDEKVCIENANIQNNLINIIATSSISF